MNYLILKKSASFLENGKDGEMANEAKQYIENSELWKAHIILRGLGLNCAEEPHIIKKTRFERYTKNNLTFIKVNVFA